MHTLYWIARTFCCECWFMRCGRLRFVYVARFSWSISKVFLFMLSFSDLMENIRLNRFNDFIRLTRVLEFIEVVGIFDSVGYWLSQLVFVDGLQATTVAAAVIVLKVRNQVLYDLLYHSFVLSLHEILSDRILTVLLEIFIHIPVRYDC